MTKIEKVTSNIKIPNYDLEILKKHFPNYFDKNGDFQFEKFKSNLKDKEVNFSTESYSLDWLGKSYARLIASDSATTLLKADEIHNSKPENQNSQNLLIKGDNLEVLKHLVHAYYGQVKMIYIDPPYNTGNDGFVYEDDRKFTVKELQSLLGIDEEKAKRILDFTSSKSNSHSAWLTFLYPRLYIAKKLLSDEGIIFVSIDDNEVAQLKIMMDEIFDDGNFVANCPRKTVQHMRDTANNTLQVLNDFVLVYAKVKTSIIFNKKFIGVREFTFKDEKGSYYLGAFQNSGSAGTREARPNLYFPIFELQNGELSLKPENSIKEHLPHKVGIKDGRWLWSKEKFDKDKEFLTVYNNKIYRKVYEDESEDQDRYQNEKTWLDNFLNANGARTLNDMEMRGFFDYAKPLDLIIWCLNLISDKNDIILDFFAGSGTTGHAVMQLNAEDGGNRNFILVQLAEKIDPNKNKVAYDFVKDELKAEPTIFEITKERLLRAAKKIKAEIINSKIVEKENEIKNFDNKLNLEDSSKTINQLNDEIMSLKEQDIGFKIFETTPIWEDYNFEVEEFDNTETLFDAGKLTEEDIKTLLTTWKTNDGISLSIDLQKIALNNYAAYYGNGKLYLMNKGFTTENLKELLEKIDTEKEFHPTAIICFGYHFESSRMRELAENVKSYANKKNIDIDFIIRY